MGGNLTFCTDSHETKPKADYFAHPEDFCEPVLFDSDQSIDDLDNVSFVSNDRLQKKWDKQKKTFSGFWRFRGKYILRIVNSAKQRSKEKKKQGAAFSSAFYAYQVASLG